MADIIGLFKCTNCGCCDNAVRLHDDQNCTPERMRCQACGCRNPRIEQLTLRLYIQGGLTLGRLEEATDLAKRLGGGPDVLLIREADTEAYYYSIPTAGIQTRIEIESLRKN